ncbi:hypothetical protein HPB52_002342 [Rhipicephalus sanguineus]|uniref:Uncharacterized protein n=1 Tax=Rhipicephalus sanguineus TaxID=34632 RepID=A0A9D4QE48_RHISA|nr:hypothetical protein HPB52_002342 [Rhipicephalus sanguineus]
MQSTKNPFFLLLQLLTMLASAPCQEAQTDGFHLPSKGASNWNDTARFSSWCLTSREQVVQGGPPTLLQSSSSAWNRAWQCPVFDSTASLPVATPIISECSSASSSPSHKFISSRHPPRDFSGHGRAAAMQSTKNPFFLLLQQKTPFSSRWAAFWAFYAHLLTSPRGRRARPNERWTERRLRRDFPAAAATSGGHRSPWIRSHYFSVERSFCLRSEGSVPSTDIVDEGLFTVVALRKRRQQSKGTKGSATDKATSAKIPPKKKTSRVSWRPTAMPRIAAEDFTIVLKPRITVDLKATFHPGELGAKLTSYVNATNSDSISVWPMWEQNIIVVATEDINSANLLAREFSLETSQGPLPMIGHAKISGEVHAKQDFAACSSRVGIMAAAAPRSSGQRPRHLTSRPKDVTRELPTKPPRTLLPDAPISKRHFHPKHHRRHRRRHPIHLTTIGPVLPAGDFPPLTDAGALRRATKKTSSQVGTGARAASSSCSSFPTSSPVFLKLKQELAALRAQNAQLLAKIATLEAGSAPVTPASPLPPLTEITVNAPEPTPMSTTPSVSEPSNTEERFQAIENAMTALMAQLTNMSKSFENLSVTVTQQVTSNIKTWLHGANPRSRRASPLKDVNRPSKFSHAIDLPEVSEDSELLLAQGTEVGVESLPATPNSQYGDST